MLSKFLIWELLQNKKTIGYFQTALTFFNISLKPSKAGFNQAIFGKPGEGNCLDDLFRP